MTSQRKLKKPAGALGLTHTEFQLVELLEEVLDSMRWMQVSQVERDQILEAASRAVDQDQKMHEWQERVGRLKTEIVNIQRRVDGLRSEFTQPAGQGREQGTAQA